MLHKNDSKMKDPTTGFISSEAHPNLELNV